MNQLRYRNILLLILMSSFFSCNQKTYKNAAGLNSLVTGVDKLEIYFYRENDTLKTIVTQKENINIINALVDGKVDESIEQCKPSGNILFFKKNKIIFESYFSIANTNNNKCQQLSYFLAGQTYNTQLTYQSGMFLSELSNDLQTK